jgi:hypothetical protein
LSRSKSSLPESQPRGNNSAERNRKPALKLRRLASSRRTARRL